jgi:tRNA G18 (ribose-2'-O)-methylase SpoU
MMARQVIEQLDDPRIAIYRSLKRTNETRGREQFVVEGERLVERLLASRFPTVSVLLTERHQARLRTLIPEDVPTYVLPDPLVDELVGFPFHRGALACGQRLPWPDIEAIVDAKPEGRLTLVICPRLSNPENLGAIARIGDVFGIDAILSGPSCPDPLSRRVLRVSMGAALGVPMIVLDDLANRLESLARARHVEVLGAVADNDAEPFDGFDRAGRVALVLGEEDSGIDAEWLARCHRRITIPMTKPKASLNVAMAAGILIHHLTRRVERGTERADL